MGELKPCPYCGGAAKFIHDMETFEIKEISCQNCKVSVRWPLKMALKETFRENKRKWVEKWNRRKL